MHAAMQRRGARRSSVGPFCRAAPGYFWRAVIDPTTRGDPESPLRWTSKSLRTLARELGEQGYRISASKVGQLLHAHGYSLQAMSKTTEGKQHCYHATCVMALCAA